MAFFDLMNVEMSIVDAEVYIEENIDALDQVFNEDEPENGRKGTIWRNIWERPRRCTPMSYYLSLKLIETINDNETTLKQARKKSREQARKKLSNRIDKFETSYAELEEENIQKSEEIALQQRELDEKDQIIEELEYIGEIPVDAAKKDIVMLFERLKKYEAITVGQLSTYEYGKKMYRSK
ncbi:MAG: hypothetical protein ACI9YH_004120 [Colwellia sp.]|jgi:hypothetical protein